jgi:hypothetical protein
MDAETLNRYLNIVKTLDKRFSTIPISFLPIYNFAGPYSL